MNAGKVYLCSYKEPQYHLWLSTSIRFLVVLHNRHSDKVRIHAARYLLHHDLRDRNDRFQDHGINFISTRKPHIPGPFSTASCCAWCLHVCHHQRTVGRATGQNPPNGIMQKYEVFEHDRSRPDSNCGG